MNLKPGNDQKVSPKVPNHEEMHFKKIGLS